MNKSIKPRGNYFLLLGIALIVLTNIKLFSTKAAVKWDAFDEMWTYFRWLGSSLRQGYFPDFFPNIMAGYPIGSNIQAGTYNVFYLAFAYAFPDSVLSINLVYLVTQVVIFWLGFAIGKSYELDPLSSLYLGLALTASGFVIGHASHFSYLSTSCGLLGCFLGLRMALRNRGKATFFLLFVSVYHMFTSGYPANILFGAQCLALYWLYLFVTVVAARRTLFVAAVGAVAGGMAGAPAIWHFLNLLQQSKRGDGLDIETAMSGSLPLYALLNYFIPVWKMGYAERTIERFHLMFLSVPLFAYGIWMARSRGRDGKKIFVFFALAVLLTVLALGKNSPVPLRVWLAEHLFIYRAGRFPSGEHRGVALFLLALVSAFGLHWIQERFPRKQKVLLSILALDFLIVMVGLRGMRIGSIDEKYRGDMALFQAGFSAGEQSLLDKPRDCTPDGELWALTAIDIQRDRLAPANFYWNGYVGLRDQVYDMGRETAEDLVCGSSRLRLANGHAPRAYELVTYTPGYIKFRISNDVEQSASQLVWTEYNDGFWNLKINGNPAPLGNGPAQFRTFAAASGDIVEMSYAGPLSRLWR